MNWAVAIVLSIFYPPLLTTRIARPLPPETNVLRNCLRVRSLDIIEKRYILRVH